MAVMTVVLTACATGAPSTSTGTVSSTSLASVSTTTVAPTTAQPITSPPSTLPAPAPALLVVGDFGTANRAETAIAKAMEKVAKNRPIDVFVTTGDNFYSNNLDANWTKPFGWVDDQEIPIWATWGNHDIESARRRELVRAALDDPKYWYAKQWEGVEFVFLDANRPSDRDQLAWLRDHLAGIDPSTLVVAVFHQPALSCAHYGDTQEVVEGWLPLFDKHDVDLVLNGHDHNYQRFEDGDTTYVVTGGGGRSLYELDDCPTGHPERVGGAAKHHFLLIERTASGLVGTALDSDGDVLDQFFISS